MHVYYPFVKLIYLKLLYIVYYCLNLYVKFIFAAYKFSISRLAVTICRFSADQAVKSIRSGFRVKILRFTKECLFDLLTILVATIWLYRLI